MRHDLGHSLWELSNFVMCFRADTLGLHKHKREGQHRTQLDIEGAIRANS